MRFLVGIAIALVGFAGFPAAASAHRGDTPQRVILVASPGHQASLVRAVGLSGGTVITRLDLIDGLSALVPASKLAQLSRRPDILSITPDFHVRPLGSTYDAVSDTGSLYNTTLMTGARALWGQGITGKGVDVALIDSGVTPVAGLSTNGKIVNGPDLSWESQSPNTMYLDTYGHGTHMAGIIAGRDQSAPPGNYAADSSDFLGMAPDARIVNVKVASYDGGADVTQVIAAIDWVVQHRRDNGLNIRLINLSYGTDSAQPYALDPLAYAAEQAWLQGITVIAAAGNDGLTSLGVADPAIDPYVIAVGAADTQGTDSYGDDSVASFSDYGNVLRDPDLVAPGVHIAGLRVPGSYIDQQYGATAQVGTRFFRGSGTSQATAVVTGGAALLLQQRPWLTPDQLKLLLTSSADHLGGLLNLDLSQGHGELDLKRAGWTYAAYTRQSYLRSTGVGLVELSRGTRHVVWSGVSLTGEQDIFLNGVETAALAAQEANATAWSAGDWNGGSWSGGSWSGGSWSGSSWSGGSWSGGSWSGGSWSSNEWSGGSWSGGSWSGGSWSGAAWSSAGWS